MLDYRIFIDALLLALCEIIAFQRKEEAPFPPSSASRPHMLLGAGFPKAGHAYRPPARRTGSYAIRGIDVDPSPVFNTAGDPAVSPLLALLARKRPRPGEGSESLPATSVYNQSSGLWLRLPKAMPLDNTR